jgi:hypothetical protein
VDVPQGGIKCQSDDIAKLITLTSADRRFVDRLSAIVAEVYLSVAPRPPGMVSHCYHFFRCLGLCGFVPSFLPYAV